jgi:hypothetical protein
VEEVCWGWMVQGVNLSWRRLGDMEEALKCKCGCVMMSSGW